MRTSFSCILCVLLVALCWARTMSAKDTDTKKLLEHTMRLLKPLIQYKWEDIFLHSPTNDIEDCCSQSALECFRKGLSFTNNIHVKKLNRNLGKPSIMASMTSKNCTETVKCMPCESYPLLSSKQFLLNLQSSLQKAYSRLS